MNYYYRRYVAVLLTAFLLAAAAPFALAQKDVNKKAPEKKTEEQKKEEQNSKESKKGSYATAQVLCSGLLSKSLLFSPKAAEFCAQHGVTAVSVFPNGSASSYYGTVSDAEIKLKEAQEYYDQCKQNLEKAGKEVARLEEEISKLENGPERNKKLEELKQKQQELENIKKDMEAAKAAIKDAQAYKDSLDKLTPEEWEKMAGEYKNRYEQWAKDAQKKSSEISSMIDDGKAKAADYQKAADEALAKYNKAKEDGDEEAAKKYWENYEGYNKDLQATNDWVASLEQDKANVDKEGADWANTAANMNSEMAQTLAYQEADAKISGAEQWAKDAQEKYDYIYSEYQAVQEEYNNVPPYTPTEDEQAEINKLTNELNNVATPNYNYAEQQYNDAAAALGEAETNYNNAQSGSGSTGGGQECWKEKQCHKEKKKDCWIDKETGKEECKYWEEEVCEEVEVCK